MADWRDLYRQPLSARRWSNAELRRFSSLFEGDVVNVSGSGDGDKEGFTYGRHFSGSDSYSLTNYPGFRGFEGRPGEIPLDLTEDLPSDLVGRFDVVFNHTTLEHIFEVRAAFRNLCTMTRDIVIVVVPFAQQTHWSDDFGDYWRFTPMGLRLLFEENGLTVMHEAASPMERQDIYLLVVGSKQPEKWKGRLPDGHLGAPIGTWISAPSLFGRIRRMAARALDPLGKS
jgi:hypothetical protein